MTFHYTANPEIHGIDRTLGTNPWIVIHGQNFLDTDMTCKVNGSIADVVYVNNSQVRCKINLHRFGYVPGKIYRIFLDLIRHKYFIV